MQKRIQNSNKPKATICRNKNCVTVEGDTARFVNGVVTIVAATALITTVAKLLK